MNRPLFAAVLLTATAAALYAVMQLQDELAVVDDGASEDGIMGATLTKLDELAGALSGPGPASGMSTSTAMLYKLRRRERLVLTPYNLGDGGWTVGYGHFEKTREALPVLRNQADAEALFAQDVINRAEKWVKLYVTVPVTQNQFDALVSIAFNMSPRSFKKFADAVNAGQGIDAIAQRSVSWVPEHLQAGIANRREDELQVFNQGIYA